LPVVTYGEFKGVTADMGGKLVVRPNRGRIAGWLSFFCRSMTRPGFTEYGPRHCPLVTIDIRYAGAGCFG